MARRIVPNRSCRLPALAGSQPNARRRPATRVAWNGIRPLPNIRSLAGSWLTVMWSRVKVFVSTGSSHTLWARAARRPTRPRPPFWRPDRLSNACCARPVPRFPAKTCASGRRADRVTSATVPLPRATTPCRRAGMGRYAPPANARAVQFETGVALAREADRTPSRRTTRSLNGRKSSTNGCGSAGRRGDPAAAMPVVQAAAGVMPRAE